MGPESVGLEFDGSIMKKLHVVEGPLRGKAFDVQDRATIGRQGKADIQLEGRFVGSITEPENFSPERLIYLGQS